MVPGRRGFTDFGMRDITMFNCFCAAGKEWCLGGAGLQILVCAILQCSTAFALQGNSVHV